MSVSALSDHFIYLLDDAVADVFAIMLALPCLPATGCRTQAPGFTASILFTGSLTGTCAVSLDRSSVALLTTQLTGEVPTSDSPFLADMAGELCNMIAGSWKNRLDAPLATCQLSTPTVTTKHPAASTRAYRFQSHCIHLELTIA